MRYVQVVILALLMSACASAPTQAVRAYGTYVVALETAADMADDERIPLEVLEAIDVAQRVVDPYAETLRVAITAYLTAAKAGEDKTTLDRLLAALKVALDNAKPLIDGFVVEVVK